VLPKKRSASVATNKIDIGALVDFEHSGKPLLGVVQGEKKGKWTVLSQTGRALDLPADRLFLLHSQLPAELTTTSQQTAHLSTLATDSEAAAKTLDLEPLWELVSEEGKDFEIYELHELLNPKGKALELLTLRRALSHDRVFFKRKKFLFAPRPVEVVKDLKRQRAIETEKRVAREALVEALVERIAKKSTEPLPDLISIVEELATLGNASPHAKDALEVIELLGSRLKMEFHGRPEDRAFKLLVRASYFSPDENMSLRRLSRSVRFSDEVLDAAEEMRKASE